MVVVVPEISTFELLLDTATGPNPQKDPGLPRFVPRVYMAMRKWLVRGLVMTLAGVISLAALLYQQWTNPEAIRQQVLGKLSTQFTGAHVSLESAHMRLFGGIALNELRITRRDDPERVELLYVPTSTIHIDKENLTACKLVIR